MSATFCPPLSWFKACSAGGAPALPFAQSSEAWKTASRPGANDHDRTRVRPRRCSRRVIAPGGTTPTCWCVFLRHAGSIGALAIAMSCVPPAKAPMPCAIDIRLLTGQQLADWLDPA